VKTRSFMGRLISSSFPGSTDYSNMFEVFSNKFSATRPQIQSLHTAFRPETRWPTIRGRSVSPAPQRSLFTSICLHILCPLCFILRGVAPGRKERKYLYMRRRIYRKRHGAFKLLYAVPHLEAVSFEAYAGNSKYTFYSSLSH
jgi:hypothetical protein